MSSNFTQVYKKSTRIAGHTLLNVVRVFDGIRKLYLPGGRFSGLDEAQRQGVVSRNWSGRYSFKGRFNVDEEWYGRPGWKVSLWKKSERAPATVYTPGVLWFRGSLCFRGTKRTVLPKHCAWSCLDSCLRAKLDRQRLSNWPGRTSL